MELTQRDRVIEQAMQMFVLQGIKSVRMDDIASGLGISKRTLYEMFDNKEELLYLSMINYFDQQHKRCEERCAGAKNVLEALFIELSGVLDGAQESNRMMENLQKFYPTVYEKLMTEGQEKYKQEFRRMLEQGVADGFFIPDFNIELAISMLYYTATAVVVRRDLRLPDGMPEQLAYVQIVSVFFRGIATEEGLRLIDIYRSERLNRKF